MTVGIGVVCEEGEWVVLASDLPRVVDAVGTTLTRGCVGMQHKLDSAFGVELYGLLQIDAIQF